VTNSDDIKNVIEEAINKYKRPPSITVNCAGITRDAFILKMDESDFDLVLNVNLKVICSRENIDPPLIDCLLI
jgi:NAD(P)-dependent dehydrogenase (short-subunit alcohol dehydrogenase family)